MNNCIRLIVLDESVVDSMNLKLAFCTFILVAVFCKSPRYSFCTTQKEENFCQCCCLDLLMLYQEQADAVPESGAFFRKQ